MARISTPNLNAAVTAVVGLNSGFGSLHTGDCLTTGASEYAGVTRVASTWGVAGAASIANASTETYTTSNASACTYFGQWSAATAGTFGWGGALGSSVQAATVTIAVGAKALTGS